MNRLRSLATRRLPSGRLFTDLGRDILAAALTIAAAFAIATAAQPAQPGDDAPAPVEEASR